MQTLLPWTTAFLASVNFCAFFAFWLDKQRAVCGGRRISESDLLTLAALGGSPAAYLARSMYRHKTRKQPFSSRLATIAGMQAAALIGCGFVFG